MFFAYQKFLHAVTKDFLRKMLGTWYGLVGTRFSLMLGKHYPIELQCGWQSHFFSRSYFLTKHRIAIAQGCGQHALQWMILCTKSLSAFAFFIVE